MAVWMKESARRARLEHPKGKGVTERTFHIPWNSADDYKITRYAHFVGDEVERLLMKLGIWSPEEDKMLRKKGQSKKALLKAAMNPDRIELMAAAEEKIFEKLPKIVEKACELAMHGDIQAMKLILDRTIPTFKQKEERVEGSRKGITINITGTNTLLAPREEAIEGEIVAVPERNLKGAESTAETKEIEHVK